MKTRSKENPYDELSLRGVLGPNGRSTGGTEGNTATMSR